MQFLFIVWSDSYNTGIDILDEQYRGLTSIINSFFFHRADKNIDRILVPTAEMFKSYVKINFLTVEKLMRDAHYSKLEEYAEVHEEILENIIAFDRTARAERDPDKLLNYLKDYWLESVKHNSADYIPYLTRFYASA